MAEGQAVVVACGVARTAGSVCADRRTESHKRTNYLLGTRCAERDGAGGVPGDGVRGDGGVRGTAVCVFVSCLCGHHDLEQHEACARSPPGELFLSFLNRSSK